MNRNKTIFALSLLAFLMAIVVVVLGAYTRLADAGLGCPDWPTCYGHLWVPTTEGDIARANENFADTPVETHKTWPEQIHRIFASSLGLVILGIFIIAFRNRAAGKACNITVVLLLSLVGATVARIVFGSVMDVLLLLLAMLYFACLFRQYINQGYSPNAYKLISLLAGLVILQGWFGMWTVTLKLWPQVVTAHLLGGFTLLSLLWLLVQRSGGYGWELPEDQVLRVKKLIRLAVFAFFVVAIQIALGGWTSSNYAALACPDFPTCHGSWWPGGDFRQGFNLLQHVGPNYLGGQLDNHARTAIHLAHRVGAIMVFFSVSILVIQLLRVQSNTVRKWAFITLGVLCLQIALGVTNVMEGLPLMVAVAHNAVGAGLLLCVVTLIHRIYGAKSI